MTDKRVKQSTYGEIAMSRLYNGSEKVSSAMVLQLFVFAWRCRVSGFKVHDITLGSSIRRTLHFAFAMRYEQRLTIICIAVTPLVVICRLELAKHDCNALDWRLTN
jgi:hypothetical protein